MIEAGDEMIPMVNARICKRVPVWNDNVDKYFKSSLFWHNIWKENGCPDKGILWEPRRKTRSQYQKACKLVKQQAENIKSEKLVEVLSYGWTKEFWGEVNKDYSNKSYYPFNVMVLLVKLI